MDWVIDTTNLISDELLCVRASRSLNHTYGGRCRIWSQQQRLWHFSLSWFNRLLSNVSMASEQVVRHVDLSKARDSSSAKGCHVTSDWTSACLCSAWIAHYNTRPRTLGQLAIKDLFGNPVIIHTDHMTRPSKLSCYQVGFYTVDLTTLKDRRVWDQFLPFDMRNSTCHCTICWITPTVRWFYWHTFLLLLVPL